MYAKRFIFVRCKNERKNCPKTSKNCLLFTLRGDLHDNEIGCVKRNSSIAISSSCFPCIFRLQFAIFPFFYCKMSAQNERKRKRKILNPYLIFILNWSERITTQDFDRRVKEQNMRNLQNVLDSRLSFDCQNILKHYALFKPCVKWWTMENMNKTKINECWIQCSSSRVFVIIACGSLSMIPNHEQ